jgi:hypothetical protein
VTLCFFSSAYHTDASLCFPDKKIASREHKEQMDNLRC